ncbi:hypothetical protein J4447_03250 [Candidatus Pacearchaeota archaeon]|nr:hypothetical protein [Candidatus Pacearchaeota archaeon]
MEEKRAKFLKVYANLPEDIRKDILVMVDNKPYTWNSTFIEIKENTALGEKILKTLESMGLL